MLVTAKMGARTALPDESPFTRMPRFPRHASSAGNGIREEVESACKPGSVRLATRQSFLSARRRRLAPATYPGTTRAALSFPYLVLLRVGFTVPYDVGPVRGALLPHPFTLTCALAGHRRSALCCTGRQLTLPRSYLALCPAEPGLSSMRLRATRLSGRLHGRVYRNGERGRDTGEKHGTPVRR